MSAPYTHTVELAYNANCVDKIVSIVDERFALILTDTTYAQACKCSHKATNITGKHYRVAIHTDNTYIISQIQ